MPTIVATILKWVVGAVLVTALIFIPVRCQKQKYIDQGKAEVQEKWDAAVERGKAEVAKLKRQQTVVTTKTEYVYLDKIKVIKEKGDEIIKRVEVFVPTDSCKLDGGFRVFHDAAVQNRIPDTAEIPNAAPTTATDVAATVAENYKQCHVAYARVNAWETWAKEMCALNEKGCP